MTYLAGLHVIGVKSLFHVDWFECWLAASSVGIQLAEGKIRLFACSGGELTGGFDEFSLLCFSRT
jgi:hypothetical protein